MSSDDDSIPTSDVIEGAKHPSEAAAVIGHRDADNLFVDALNEGRLHHAWMITGPKGIGKATLAFRFARFALAHPDARSAEVGAATSLALPDDHPDVRKIAGGAHPGLLHLKRPYDPKRKGKDKIRQDLTVDEIRRTVPFFGSTGSEGSWRICIVDAADDLNRSAANAILKILEEPPKIPLRSHLEGRSGTGRCHRIESGRPCAGLLALAQCPGYRRRFQVAESPSSRQCGTQRRPDPHSKSRAAGWATRASCFDWGDRHQGIPEGTGSHRG